MTISRPTASATSSCPGQLRVEGRLTIADPEQLKIGMEMELVLDPLSLDEDGNQVVTYAFAPVENGDQS